MPCWETSQLKSFVLKEVSKSPAVSSKSIFSKNKHFGKKSVSRLPCISRKKQERKRIASIKLARYCRGSRPSAVSAKAGKARQASIPLHTGRTDGRTYDQFKFLCALLSRILERAQSREPSSIIAIRCVFLTPLLHFFCSSSFPFPFPPYYFIREITLWEKKEKRYRSRMLHYHADCSILKDGF